MGDLSSLTQKLIQKYQEWQKSLELKEEIPTIHVDEVASKVAVFYEKIRGVVEWREEHLLRKAAIERALKRRLLLSQKSEEIAEPLVLELIRGGHFPTDSIPEEKIKEVKKIIDKYLFILKNSPSPSQVLSANQKSQRDFKKQNKTWEGKPPKEKLKVQLSNWLLSVAAAEIEEILSPPLREKALMEYMSEIMRERIRIIEGIVVFGGISEKEKNTQIYIAVQKALFKLDSTTITYHLLQKRYPNWENLPQTTLSEISQNIYQIWEDIEKDLSHPLAGKFYKICERYDTIYLILGDIISQNLKEIQKILKNPQSLEENIIKVYQERAKKLKGKVFRAAIYSTISIFLTKVLLAFLIEVPFDKYITGQFDYFVLGMNIIIPPLLMLFLVATIRLPGKDNLNRVIMETMKIVYQKERKEIYEIKIPRKRGIIFNALIGGFYLFTFLTSFGIIIWGLKKLNFGVLSMAIFLMFFSLISFAGVKIRERAKELEVVEKKAGIFAFLLDSFSLPFIQLGKWLSKKLAKYNIIIILITILIDLPFQLFTEFLEHWRSFLKEKKEEIQ